MAQGPGGERTEKATPKKRREERKEGRVATSKDIIVVASLFGCFYFLQIFFPILFKVMRDVMVFFLSAVSSIEGLPNDTLHQLSVISALELAKCVLPLGIVSMAIAIIVTGIQTRFLFTMKPVGFKMSNLNPLNGIRNLFSVRNLVELFKAALKILILSVVLYRILKSEIGTIAQMMDINATASFAYALKEIMKMVWQIGMVFAVIAGADYLYQRWTYEQRIKMTKEEVKEEYKQLEGDPKIKSKIRGLQQKMARSRMMQAVPDADVIIRNPTHYAVALKYDIDHDHAPVLIAKGQDYIALKIIEIAEQNQVTIIENKPLARGIYASTPLNSEIPAEYYGVVAEILVKVFRMNKKLG